MSDYYKIDSRKLTLREYWNIYPSPKAIIPWLMARLQMPTKFNSGMRLPDSVRELEVTEESLPPEALAKLRPLLEECRRLGFHSPRFYSFANLRNDTRTTFASLMHQSGEYSVRLMHTMAFQLNPPKEGMLKVLLSEFADGTYFFTSDQPEKFLPTSGVTGTRLLGASLAQMIASHEQNLAQRRTQNPPKSIPSEANEEFWDRYEKHSIAFNVKRGLYVRMTPEEVEHERQIMAGAKEMAVPQSQHAQVLVAISALQNKKSGWAGVITLLAVSLILFVTIRPENWSWELVLILLPVLFFHELGHYLAMRAFHYRNLKMFFIPFFGAAVSGQHFNVPGWKKVIVSLMGPVPGIFLGLAVGGVGLLLHQALFTKVALMLLVVNCFNLLPILPFDGGWVFHALLFCRHPLLDSAFRGLAAFGLMAFGIFARSPLLIILSVIMLLAIRRTYQLASIAADLRQRGVPPASADNQTIPPETAQIIIGEVKKSYPRLPPTKIIAQESLQVFETLNARPPRWSGTIGLLFVYFLSLSVAVAFAVVFITGQTSSLHSVFAEKTAKHKLLCGQIQTWSGEQSTSPKAKNTIVATLPHGTNAAKAFGQLTNRLPAEATLKTFGESLLLTLPADSNDARKLWVGELKHLTKDVFVAGTNFSNPLTITCKAPNDKLAQNVADELRGYFETLPAQSLIPPWLPTDNRSADELARHQLARTTYLTLANIQYTTGHDDAEMKTIGKQIAAAMKQGNEAQAEELQKKIIELQQKARREKLEAARTSTNGPLDLILLDLFIASTTNSFEQLDEVEDPASPIYNQMAERMGQLPSVGGVVSPEADRFSAEMGVVTRYRSTIQISYATFKQIADGAPALTEWLCNQGCSDLQYGFQFDSRSTESEDE